MKQPVRNDGNEAALLLDAQLAAAFAQVARLEREWGVPPPGIEGARQRAREVRARWNEGGPTLASVERRAVPGPTREVPVVVYRPRNTYEASPVFVFLHGGGFKIGDEWSNDRQMREIASEWGGVVISADYLHAPEHVFPAAVDEVASLLQWLHDHGGEWGLDTDRIAFGGTSAGACIAFGAVAHLGGAPWLRAAVGIVGAFDFDTTTRSMECFGNAGLFPRVRHQLT